MKLSSLIRPISYLKAHAAEIVRNLAERQGPMVCIIYRVLEHNVYVLLIADGRRHMQSLFQRRLLDA